MDWERFQALEPEGCFVAEVDGRGVGTAVAVIFGEVAWLAMVLVDPVYRGRGIGMALLEHALKFVNARGVASVRLDATPLGQPLYEKLGFVPQYALTRYAGRLATDCGSEFDDDDGRLRLEQYNHGVFDLDQAVTSTPRQKFLTRLIGEYPQSLQLAVQQEKLNGFILARRGSQAMQIGPCIAQPDAGEWLLSRACRQHRGQLVYLDVPVPHVAANGFAKRMSLVPARQLCRMCRGREVSDDLLRLWASSGPELG
jgi:hypothetical protein